jgi:site-specific DNA-cytosine methylase
MNELTVAGVVSGIGNLYGFKEGGFTPTYLVDHRKFIKKAKKTIEANFEDLKIYDDYTEALDQSATVIVSSPSCAQISALGIKRQDRYKLHDLDMADFEFIQAVANVFERNAEFIVIEYLKKFLKYFNITHTGITRVGSDEHLPFPDGYRAQLINLDARTYGVPQRRQRIYIFLSKRQYDFVYVPPETWSLDMKTVGEVMKELEFRRSIKVYPINGDEKPKHSDVRIDGFNKLKPGESYYGSQNNRKLKLNEYCPVITSHCTQHVHPTEPRTLTVRESAIFQGFPEYFTFKGSRVNNLDVVGKTVSPKITMHFAQKIKESIKRWHDKQRLLEGFDVRDTYTEETG